MKNHEEIKWPFNRTIFVRENINLFFPIVEASKLSLGDRFLRHKPETKKQEIFKDELLSVIEHGVRDFRAQKMDPSRWNNFIFYQVDQSPGTGLTTKKWRELAKEFMPERNSRLGKRTERIAFLGLLIKDLVEFENYTISDAWKAICDQSKDLGHYANSKKAKEYRETTGNRLICDWYDLANTRKLTLNDGEGSEYRVFGGCNLDKGHIAPLSRNYDYRGGDAHIVGWFVMDV